MGYSVYLFFNGNCEEAMNFYKETLGGTIEFVQRFKNAPMPSDEGQGDKIMHGSMNIGGSMMLFSDSDGKSNVSFGDNFSISLNFNTADEQTQAFNALSEGGAVTMELQDTFWGSRFGMCKDKFGVNWMFSLEQPKEEQEAAHHTEADASNN